MAHYIKPHANAPDFHLSIKFMNRKKKFPPISIRLEEFLFLHAFTSLAFQSAADIMSCATAIQVVPQLYRQYCILYK